MKSLDSDKLGILRAIVCKWGCLLINAVCMGEERII